MTESEVYLPSHFIAQEKGGETEQEGRLLLTSSSLNGVPRRCVRQIEIGPSGDSPQPNGCCIKVGHRTCKDEQTTREVTKGKKQLAVTLNTDVNGP